jgi:Uma2 family endonuclease
MSEAAHRPHYTFEEYLRLEEMSNVRHEYADGEIWAMAGGSLEHGRICANLITLLSSQLAERRCEVFTSDVRVRVRASGLDTYPDVSVVCGRIERDDLDSQALANPVVLVEVTSPGTDAYDRGAKLEHYKRIPSLREVLVVSHAEPRADVWSRQEDGSWTTQSADRGGLVRLVSIDCELPVESIYRDRLAAS